MMKSFNFTYDGVEVALTVSPSEDEYKYIIDWKAEVKGKLYGMTAKSNRLSSRNLIADNARETIDKLKAKA